MGGGKHLAPPGSSASIYSLRPVTPGPTGNIELDSEAAVEAVTSSHVVMSSPAHSAQNDPGLNVLATKSSWINALILKDRRTGRLVVTHCTAACHHPSDVLQFSHTVLSTGRNLELLCYPWYDSKAHSPVVLNDRQADSAKPVGTDEHDL